MPATPPAAARDTLSTRNCRTRRLGPAPSAVRIATSGRRRLERASNRLATLTAAISSTNSTAVMSRNSSGLTGAVKADLSGSRVIPVSLFTSGYSLARPRATACRSASACSRLTPGFRRPTTSIAFDTLRLRNPGAVHAPIGR